MQDFILKEFKSELEESSQTMCLAKWLQVTILLQNGTTHSCHHPIPHKVPLEELKQSPSALHNTFHKKFQRRLMIDGKRPPECDYCWKVEDTHLDNISDRLTKSSESWARPHLAEVKKMKWSANVNPTYVEVSFGNECNFKCAYCSPVISSSIMKEFQKHGHFTTSPWLDLAYLESRGELPIPKDEPNPYVDAFWEWLPQILPGLEVLRITGGEPLLNQNTFRFFEEIAKSPRPDLKFAINSNLGVPDVHIERFIELARPVIEQKKVGSFEFYTSLDTIGAQAEYIRFGLDYQAFLTNLNWVLRELPSIKVTLMCTFNALSMPRFPEFISTLEALKHKYVDRLGNPRILLSVPYLRSPRYLSAWILPETHHEPLERSLDQMLRSDRFSPYEINQVRRLLESLKNSPYPDGKASEVRSEFRSFIEQYDSRRGTNFLETFPELKPFWDSLK